MRRPIVFGKYGLRRVAIGSCAFLLFQVLAACGMVDSEQRLLSVTDLGGDIVQTSLTDTELTAQGARVAYRFKSVPNLVYLKNAPPQLETTPLFLSADFFEGMEKTKKTEIVEPKKMTSLAADVSAAKKPFEFDGFAEAQRKIAEKGFRLSDVNVAIIDSGVVPATTFLASALTLQLNLTTDFNPRRWQPHGTAIGSLFAGMARDAKNLERENTYAPNAKIQSIKISFQGDSPESLRRDLGAVQLAVALDEAVNSGAKIVNLSFSYRDVLPPQVSSVEKYIMAQAAKKGVVFIAAAGNANENLNIKKLYPARYDLENVIVVGNHTAVGRHVSSSNYGTSIDLTACGHNLALTNLEGGFDFFSGTSFSGPVVAAALALYRGVKPDAPLSELLADLYSTTQPSYVQGTWDSPRAADGSLAPLSRYGRLDAAALVGAALEAR